MGRYGLRREAWRALALCGALVAATSCAVRDADGGQQDVSTTAVLDAARAHDWTIVGRAAKLEPVSPSAVAAALQELDPEAREIVASAVAAQGRPEQGALMVHLTGDPSVQVQTIAARALGKLASPPPANVLLAAVPARDNPFVRRQLYLAVGRTGERDALAPLRAFAAAERDPDAALDAEVAAIRLGAAAEQARFLDRVRKAEPRDALAVRERLLYVGDPALAKGMLRWLSNEASVMRLGSDRDPKMARMCDIAIWTAYQLGVQFQILPAHLANYDDAVRANALRALSALRG
jgi:hypothetical protein